MTLASILRLTTTLWIAAAVPANAAPMLIDDFSTAQQDDSNGLFDVPGEPGRRTNRGAVQGTGILGDERDAIVGATGPGVAVDIGDGHADLAGSNITLEWDGVQGGTGAPDNAAQLPPTDLTDGGTNDHVTASVLSASGSIQATLTLEDEFGERDSLSIDGVTAGALDFSFASPFLQVDLTRIVGIQLGFRDLDDSQWSLSLGTVDARSLDGNDAAGAVPEPGAALLFGAGVLVTMRRRTGAGR